MNGVVQHLPVDTHDHRGIVQENSDPGMARFGLIAHLSEEIAEPGLIVLGIVVEDLKPLVKLEVQGGSVSG